MKTDHDLLFDFMRGVLSGLSNDTAKIDLLMHQVERQCEVLMRTPRPLSDEDYASQLEAIKNQDLDLHHPMSLTAPQDLPADMKPFPGRVGSN